MFVFLVLRIFQMFMWQLHYKFPGGADVVISQSSKTFKTMIECEQDLMVNYPMPEVLTMMGNNGKLERSIKDLATGVVYNHGVYRKCGGCYCLKHCFTRRQNFDDDVYTEVEVNAEVD